MRDPCLIEECKRGPLSRGLCGAHYPMIWALIKLGVVSQKELTAGGFLLPSKHAKSCKKQVLRSRTGYTIKGDLEVNK